MQRTHENTTEQGEAREKSLNSWCGVPQASAAGKTSIAYYPLPWARVILPQMVLNLVPLISFLALRHTQKEHRRRSMFSSSNEHQTLSQGQCPYAETAIATETHVHRRTEKSQRHPTGCDLAYRIAAHGCTALGRRAAAHGTHLKT